jgi:hypothetical protein
MSPLFPLGINYILFVLNLPYLSYYVFGITLHSYQLPFLLLYYCFGVIPSPRESFFPPISRTICGGLFYDILIYSPTLDGHVNLLQLVFQVVKEQKLYLMRKERKFANCYFKSRVHKCHFIFRETIYINYL